MPSFEIYIEHDVLQRMAQGDESAFRELFHHYKQKVYTVALKLTRSETMAEELLQDVFLTIWLKRDRFTEVRNFDAYLFTIVRNHAYSALKSLAAQKKSDREVSESLPLFLHDTEDKLSDNELSSLLMTAVDRLPPQQKQVYELIKQQGYSREQAAKEMDIQPDTVKTHLARAVKSIRAFCLANLKLIFFVLTMGVLTAR